MTKSVEVLDGATCERLVVHRHVPAAAGNGAVDEDMRNAPVREQRAERMPRTD